MELRDYQKQVIKEIEYAWITCNLGNVGIQLPTGAGKTVIISNIAAREKGMSVLIAHRVELVSQISLTLGRHGVRHGLIAPRNAVRNIVALHMAELGRSFYDPNAYCKVGGVDTIVRMNEPWFKNVNLVIQDEGHHPLKKNKWGKVAELFPKARGLYPTATPVRADGCGLGRHADGVLDRLVVGPSMRELIDWGYLTDYRILVPPNNLDLSEVPLSASGDFSPPKLRNAVHKSCITGNIVAHYLKFAKGKLGVTFAVDIQAATEIAAEFRTQGVAAEVITGKTPDLLRAQIMNRFRNREILQLVNVDLLGEGVDVPGIEVVSLGRPTESLAVYQQQVGRALRPMPDKDKAIIIDHVGNVLRHGLPDKLRTWSLDRRERRSKNDTAGEIALKVCANPECLLAYERTKRICPYCGFYMAPMSRTAIEHVDGDLIELDAATLAKLRGEVNRIDGAPRIPGHLDSIAQRGVLNRHRARQDAQGSLRQQIALWAGYQRQLGRDDSEIYRLFYFENGIDILSAQALGATAAQVLEQKISEKLTNLNIVGV